MSTLIDKIRISYQFYFPFYNVIDQGDFRFFNNLLQYSNTFLAMLNDECTVWEKPEMYKNFWKRYVNKSIYNPRKTSTQNSFLKIIPAFLPSIHSFTKEIDNAFCTINTHCFVFPCNLCLDIDINLEFQSLPITDVVNRIIDIIYGNFFNNSGETVNINIYCQNLLHEFIKIHHIPLDLLMNDTKTYVSISFLNGKYEDYCNEIVDRQDLHSSLSKIYNTIHHIGDNPLINLSEWKKDSPFEKVNYPGNFLIEDSLLRIIWLSSNFSGNKYEGKASNLCFHNNLNMLTIQIISLLCIVNLALEEYQDLQVRNIHGILDLYNKNACVALHDLYSRKPNTYHSKSTQRLILQNDIEIIKRFLHERYFPLKT